MNTHSLAHLAARRSFRGLDEVRDIATNGSAARRV